MITSIEKLEKDLVQKEREIVKLQDEIMKDILGESAFSQNQLNEMLKTKEKERAEISEALAQSQSEILSIDNCL